MASNDNNNNNNVIVEVFELVKHLEKGSQPGSRPSTRPLEEGSKIVNSNYILMCGILDSSTSLRQKYFALCTQNSYSLEYPHEVNVEIEYVDNQKTIGAHCSCLGGNDGRCKHSLGVLLYLGRKTLKTIETLGCTDIRQQWGQIKQKVGEAYSAEPFDTFCHGTQSNIKFTKNPALSQSIYRTLCKANPESEIALHTQCTRSSSSGEEGSESSLKVPDRVLKNLLAIPNTKARTRVLCNLNPIYTYKPSDSENEDNGVLRFLKNNLWEFYLDHFPINIKTAEQAIFYNRFVVIKKERAKEILIKTVTQNNDLWHAERKLRITGSICYLMYTYMNNNHTLDEWKNKLETIYMSSFRGNAHTFRGNQLEASAIQAYHEKTGYAIEKVGFVILSNTPWLGFSPDAVAEGDTLVEVKCPKNDDKLKADELVKCQRYIKVSSDGELKLNPKHSFYGQIQLGLCMLNLRRGHLVIYEGENGSCAYVEVQRDEIFMKNLVRTLSSCYFTHVLPWLAMKHKEAEEMDVN